MKKLVMLPLSALAGISMLFGPRAALSAEVPADDKTAVVYFSLAENARHSDTPDSITGASLAAGDCHVGTTAAMARTAAQSLNARLVPLLVKNPYPAAFDAVVSRGHQEESAPPELAAIPDLHGVETLLIGYPTWNMGPAAPVMTFLEQALNRDGVKQIYVFNSNDGWGPGRGRSVIASAFPAAQVNDSVLAVDSKHGIEGAARTAAWLNSLNIKQNTAVAADAHQVAVDADGRSIRVVLNDSPEAKQFQQMLERGPVTVRMSEYGSREFYGPTDETFTVTSEGQYQFEDGTLTFCPTNNTIAIFYAQSAHPTLSMAVYPLGRVTSDLSVFKELPGRTTFTFRQAAP